MSESCVSCESVALYNEIYHALYDIKSYIKEFPIMKNSVEKAPNCTLKVPEITFLMRMLMPDLQKFDNFFNKVTLEGATQHLHDILHSLDHLTETDTNFSEIFTLRTLILNTKECIQCFKFEMLFLRFKI